jgi:hypothetical protein
MTQITELAPMSIATITETNWNGVQLLADSSSGPEQTDRIAEALGLTTGGLPKVDEETLFRYYRYLTARLSFPFTAHYLKPRSSLEEVEHRCTVLELLDPVNDICDEFDGIFCKTRKGKYEINLPLTELRVSENSPNYQLIEDYWYWFWNWR